MSYTSDNAGTLTDDDGSATSYDDGTGIWTVGTLNPGTSLTLEITADVDSGASAEPQPIVNTATLDNTDQTDSDNTNNEDTADITVGGLDLSVDKTVDTANPVEGQTITYSVTVTNESAADATDVIITDALPTGVTYDSDNAASLTDDASNPTSYDDTTGEWTIGALNAGNSLTLEITATVDSGAINETQPITNTATLTSSTPTDSDNTNNEDSADITVGELDLSVTKTVNEPQPAPGETITYSVTVENVSTVNATGVVVTDALPGGVTYDSDNAASVNDDAGNPTSYDDTTGEWSVGALNAGNSLTLEISGDGERQHGRRYADEHGRH